MTCPRSLGLLKADQRLEVTFPTSSTFSCFYSTTSFALSGKITKFVMEFGREKDGNEDMVNKYFLKRK